jgi:hypothetical protein
MNVRQQRAFQLGSALWILTGALHMIGHFSGWPEPASEEEATLYSLFQGYEIAVGGVSRTLAELFEGLSLSFAVFLFLLGFLGLLWLRAPGVPAGILRRVAGMNAVAALALLVMGLRRFPIASLVCFAAVGLAFALAALGARATTPTAPPEAGRA